jgi:hypothetical protein
MITNCYSLAKKRGNNARNCGLKITSKIFTVGSRALVPLAMVLAFMTITGRRRAGLAKGQARNDTNQRCLMSNDDMVSKAEVIRWEKTCKKCGKKLSYNWLSVKYDSYLGQGAVIQQKFFYCRKCGNNVYTDSQPV